ncbi:MAG: SIR2 family protein, partial [Methanoregula sp.]|nr:SIR2 family protein [Methanoregula sp.]
MPDTNDTLINLSFSMHSGPGTFALLLGSGISQGAEIPTGWEIVCDLIRKLATLEGEPDIDNPEPWFEEKYHEAPKYSFLIEKVAPSPTARQNLLKQYIEPTDSQREHGSKVPSQSHKSIAQLVKNGTIRVILTTNIDRLLETALGEVGITPVVIFNDDSLEGAMPYVHSPCTIIKLHGDYLDTRIKNTPDELAKYSEKMNTCLDRIFDEFGLVICGWSAKWDIALRDALYRRQNRRFSSYWAYPRNLSSEASDLKDHLRAIPLPIENADKFFQKLSENIEALQAFERPHPLSVPLAIAQVKKYLSENKYQIQLHDFVQDETNDLCVQLQSKRFSIKDLQIPKGQYKPVFQNRMHEYE